MSQVSGHAIVNAEGAFALAVVVVLFWRSLPENKVSKIFDSSRRDVWLLISIAVLTIAVFWQAVRIPFVSDDYVLVSFAEAFRGAYRVMFTRGGGDGFFRPIGYISIYWTWPWAEWDSVRWHAAGLAFHIANSLMVYVLGAMLGFSRLAAWLGSALFALHGAHPEAAVWIAGRFDLVATFFVLAGLVAFIRAWEKSSVVWGAGAAVALVLGILAKESAYALPLMMLVYASVQPSGWNRKVRFVAPFFILAAALFAYRWVLQGGIGGYVTGAGLPQALNIRALPALEAIAFRMWAILFFPIDWARSPGPVLGTAGMVYASVWVVLFWKAKVTRAKVVLPLGLVLAAAIPAVPLLLIGADLINARVLYLPSAGFCLLAAAAVEPAAPKLRFAGAGAMLLFSLAALLHNLTIWERVAQQSKMFCEAAARCSNFEDVSGVARSVDGVYFFANGLPECVRHERSMRPAADRRSCPFE